ncbi:MAG TPA: DUF6522 family protein [Steroidobacteraceae bacterium]|nr:DUF6522 family protein [Steroidobacteraceae bacterium]
MSTNAVTDRCEIDIDGTITVPAEVIAKGLRLNTLAVIPHLRRGLIRQVTARGVDEDAGRMRILFRYKSRQFTLHLNAGGTIALPSGPR